MAHIGFVRPVAATLLITGIALQAPTVRADGQPVDALSATASDWYDALATANADRLGALLAENAEIVIEDLGVTQTRAEFLDSLDAWADAIDGGSIRHVIERRSDDEVVVRVCYDFPDNDLLTRETVTFGDGGQIVRSVQVPLGEDCAGL